MVNLLLWYLMISVVGWLTFPLAYRLLPGLADRGYAFTRTLGWLLWGYLFWLLASLGAVRNDPGGLLFALLLLVLLSVWAWRGLPTGDLRAWLRSRRRLVLTLELLFLAAFAAMAAVRAANPNIEATEKPMELAFINAILRSPAFPPHDPWLSGYAISYYHFGYTLVALLAKLLGTPGGVAFNLGIALVFALSALGAYGMVYDLLVGRGDGRRETLNLALALLGPVFILLASNLEGFLEVLHARGLFWRLDPASGSWVSSIWSWLGIKDLSLPPAQPFTWLPTRFLWWWRASRVVQDYSIPGNPIEIIDEFPVFSYLLGDLHPHVLAMPFAFLAMALALNLYFGGARGRFDGLHRRVSLRSVLVLSLILLVGGAALVLAGARLPNLRLGLLGLFGFMAGGFAFVRVQPDLGKERLNSQAELGWPIQVNLPAFWLAAVALGGLGFLNTWDFPFYVALFAGAYALRRYDIFRRAAGNELMDVRPAFARFAKDFLWLVVMLGFTGILLYLPFYLGFSSQARGFLPNLINPTRGAHLWVMFGGLLLPLFVYLVYRWRIFRDSGAVRRGLGFSAGLFLGLWLLSLLFGLAITWLPQYGAMFMNNVNLAAPDRQTLLLESVIRRLANPGGWLTLLALLGLCLGLLFWAKRAGRQVEALTNASQLDRSPSHPFALLLILVGALLVIAPEFVFLFDLFGNRMNTIFKFYYQAWLLWGVAAGFGTAVLLRKLRSLSGWLFSLGLAVLLAMALTYTVLGLWEKTAGFNPPLGWTLDGASYLERQNPDEQAAVRWLRSAPDGVVAEAVGGSYSGYGRIAMLSGLPTVLGWDFHEVQWGRGDLVPARKTDIERLYCTRSPEEAQAILAQYDIRYVVVGGLERLTYQPGQGNCAAGLNEGRLQNELDLVFQQGEAAIYAVP